MDEAQGMTGFSQAELDAHEKILAERVFMVPRFPHFQQLLREVRTLAKDLPAGATVISLERGLLYGGGNLIAPFFHAQNFISVDCSPESGDERGAYNATKVDHPDFLRVATTRRAAIEATGLDSDLADLVIVPNLVHHVADQEAIFFPR